MPRFLYATPTGGHPHPGYVLSSRGLQITCKSGAIGIPDLLMTRGPVQMARSSIVSAFLQGDWDYLVMHDDDMSIDPTGEHGNPLDAWAQLMAEEPDLGMVGVVYLREHPHTIPILNLWHPDYDHTEEVTVLCGMPYGAFDVASVGTGFVMIRRKALEDLAAVGDGNGGPMFRFSIEPNRLGMLREVGEDYDFCYRLQRAGWKVMADTRFATTHHKDSGRLQFVWSDWEKQGSRHECGECGKVHGGIDLTVQPGAEIIEVRGMTCVAVDKVRNREAQDWHERQAVKSEKPPVIRLSTEAA